MVLRTGDTSPEQEIAEAMIPIIRSNPLLNQPEIHVDNPIDIDKAVDAMKVGDLFVDVWPVGITTDRKNRRANENTFEVHVGLRVKVAADQMTRAGINQLCFYRNQIQSVFTPKRSRLLLPVTGKQVFLVIAEPFAPYGRDSLSRKGLFVAPIRFEWKGVW